MSDQQARDLIARTLRDQPGADPDLLALDILHLLRGHGWRPTAARAEWAREHGPPADPAAVHDHAETARQAMVAQLYAERYGTRVPKAPGGRGEP